jgi:thiamine-phosphate pyrophosphorylase
MSTPPALPRLPHGLYVLCDDTVAPSLPLLEKAAALLDGGPALLQLRLKGTPAREAVAAARAVTALCRARGVPCLINDRVDWALLAGADGAHVGEEDLPVADARALLGPGRLLGATVRSLEDILRAQAAGADHVGLGPVFATRTKAVDAPPLGLEGLARICAASPLPVVAIAGITAENIRAVARAGATCAAVASAPFADGEAPARVAAAVRGLAADVDNGRALRSL